MMYSSILTSKGTITIPADLRKEFNLTEGDRVEIQKNAAGKIELKRMPSIEEVRAMNQAILKRNGNWPPGPYKSGDGFRTHVEEKYGKK